MTRAAAWDVTRAAAGDGDESEAGEEGGPVLEQLAALRARVRGLPEEAWLDGVASRLDAAHDAVAALQDGLRAQAGAVEGVRAQAKAAETAAARLEEQVGPRY